MKSNIYRVFKMFPDGTLTRPVRVHRDGKRETIVPVFQDYKTLNDATVALTHCTERGEFAVIRIFNLDNKK